MSLYFRASKSIPWYRNPKGALGKIMTSLPFRAPFVGREGGQTGNPQRTGRAFAQTPGQQAMLGRHRRKAININKENRKETNAI